MRIALLSDIHGNSISLEAVLSDIEAGGGVDAYWFIGDHVAIGHDPVAVLERITALPNAVFTRGNTDRYLVTGERPPPHQDEIQSDLSLLPTLLSVETGFAWTQGFLTPSGWLDWLADLPLEYRFTLPDGTRVLAVHASPGRDDGDGFLPVQEDAECEAVLNDCESDLVIAGHTHWPLDRAVNGIRIVNLGSVSNPLKPDLRASYAILHIQEENYHIEFRRVDYDRQAVIDALEAVKFPGRDYVIQHMRGQIGRSFSDTAPLPPVG